MPDKELIISILGAIAAIYAYYSNNKSTKGFEAEIRSLRLGQSETQNTLAKYMKILDHQVNADNFRRDFKNIIFQNSSKLINFSEILSSNNVITSALTNYFDEIAEFALAFFYSGYRKNPDISEKEFEKHLKKKLDTATYNLLETIKEGIKLEKALKNGNSLKCTSFMDLLTAPNMAKEPDWKAYNSLLIMRLIENGIDENELKKIFVAYVQDFLESFKSIFITFNSLIDYDIAIEAKFENDNL